MNRFRSARPTLWHIWQLAVALVLLGLPLGLLARARPPSDATLWTPLQTWPGSASVRFVAASEFGENRVLYALGRSSGIHLSFDGGQRWFRGDEGLPQGKLGEIRIVDLAISPADPNILYAIADSPTSAPRPMLYWSVDFGLTWQPRASLGQERLRAVSLGPGRDDLYVATASDLSRAFTFEEEDESSSPEERFSLGEDNLHWLSIHSWGTAATVSILRAALCPPELTERLSAASASGALEDGGAVRNAHPLILLVGTQANGLAVLLDSGGTRASALPVADDLESRYVRQRAGIHAICIPSREPWRILVGTDRGVLASEDGGISWRRSGLESQRVLALLADPARAETIYAGTAQEGVFVSQNGGYTWTSLGIGLEGAAVFSLALAGDARTIPTQRTLYAATASGPWQLDLPMDVEMSRERTDDRLG